MRCSLTCLLLGAASAAQSAELFTLSPGNYDAVVPNNTETTAFFGDFVLRNGHLTAIVADPALQCGRSASRLASFPVEGGIIALVRNDQSMDTLVCFQPVCRHTRSGIFTNRPAGQEKHPHVQGRFIDSAETWRRPDRAPQQGRRVRLSLPLSGAGVALHYILEDDWDHVEVEVEILGPDQGYSTPNWALAQVMSLGNRFHGDTNDMLWSTGRDARFAWIYDPWFGRAYGMFSEQAVSTYLPTGSGREGLHRHLRAEGNELKVQPGERFVWRSMVWPAADAFEACRISARFTGESLHELPLHVRAGTAPAASARVTARSGDRLVSAGHTDADGNLLLCLPADAEVTLTIEAEGCPAVAYEIPVGTTSAQMVHVAAPALVVGEIRDEAGALIPAKVAFRGIGGTADPYFGPPTLSVANANLRYTGNGRFRQIVPPGRYQVVVSRGPEYELAELEIEARAGEETTLQATLTRVVDTSGWISADFGSRSAVSRAVTTASTTGRILNLQAEHIEFAPAAEFDFVFDYQPCVDEMGAGAWLKTTPGIHLTQRVRWGYNDQVAFPLRHVRGAQDGGAVQRPQHVPQVFWLHTWYGGLTDRGRANWESDHEKLIIVSPPGIWPNDGRSEGMYSLFWPNTWGRENAHLDGRLADLQGYHAMAIQPLDVFLDLPAWSAEDPRGEADQQAWWADLRDRKANRWPDVPDRQREYFRILREGFRIPGVAMSSSNDNFHGNAGYRTWVRSPTDDPPDIDTMAVVRAIKLGQTIMSTGPFLSVEAHAGGAVAGPGDDLHAPGGRCSLKMAVQAPSWMRMNRAIVLVNGLRMAEHDYSRETHPELFPEGVTQFRHEIALSLPVDSFVSVLVSGEGRNLTDGPEPTRGQYAMISPFYVDVDGDGFKPHNPVDDLVFSYIDPLKVMSRDPGAPPGVIRLYLHNDADEPAVATIRIEVGPADAATLSDDGEWTFEIPPGGRAQKDFTVHLAPDFPGTHVTFLMPRSTASVGIRRAGARVEIGKKIQSWTEMEPRQRGAIAWHRDEIRDLERPLRWGHSARYRILNLEDRRER